MGLTGSATPNSPASTPSDGEIEDGLAIGAHGLGAGAKPRRMMTAELLHERGVAHGDIARHRPRREHRVRDGDSKVLDAMRSEQRGLGGLHDGRAQRMLAQTFDAGGPLHQILLTVVGRAKRRTPGWDGLR